MVEAGPVRIGMVNFINTAALYEVWKESVRRDDWRVVEAAPAELNRMLRRGELDLGFVSSFEYAESPDRYRLLSGLSISATGPVGSVFLFSHLPPGELEGQGLVLSGQSKTSNGLIKVILEDFYQVRPCYRPPGAGDDACPARLAIGDQALRLRRAGGFPHVLDLGEVWQRQTGLPFVFAVWAAREDFCRERPGQLAAMHRELVRCARQGRERLPEISRMVAPRVPMPESDCLEYLQGIALDLGPERIAGLELFYRHLIRRGEASPQALPIKIEPLASDLQPVPAG